MPCPILRIWMFLDVVFIMHQPTNRKPLPSIFCSRHDRFNDPKQYKSDHNLSEKKKKKRGRLSVCLHMRFKYKVKISDRSSQNWVGHRSNATCSHHYLSQCTAIVFLVISLDGWRIGAAQLISIVSLYVRDCLHQFSPWSGTTIFGAVTQIISRKCRQKMAVLSFLGYLGEIESDSPTVWTCTCNLLCHGQCFQFSSPNLQWLTRFDFKGTQVPSGKNVKQTRVVVLATHIRLGK